jgi:hypothetical protein
MGGGTNQSRDLRGKLKEFTFDGLPFFKRETAHHLMRAGHLWELDMGAGEEKV